MASKEDAVLYIVNIYHTSPTTEDAAALARTTTQHSGRRAAWQRVCAVRETGIVSTDPTCETREWVARIEVVSAADGYRTVWSEGELPAFTESELPAFTESELPAFTESEQADYFAQLDDVLCAGLDEVDAQVEAEALASAPAPSPQQDKQQQQIEQTHCIDSSGEGDLNAVPETAAAARRAGDVIPIARLEAKRAEVEARRKAIESEDDDEEVDLRPVLDAVGVVEVSRGLWHVSSDRDPAKGYLVTMAGNAATACDCPDRTMRRRRCKHMRLVESASKALDGAWALVERGHPVEAVVHDLRRYAARDGRESALTRLARAASKEDVR